MFSIYWPRKKVSEKVIKITFENCTLGVPSYFHGGFGLIVKRPHGLVVFGISGSFIKVNAAGGDVYAAGQSGGVYYCEDFSKFIGSLKP